LDDLAAGVVRRLFESLLSVVDCAGGGSGLKGSGEGAVALGGDLVTGERIAFLLAKDLGFAMARKSSSDESSSSFSSISGSGGGDFNDFLARCCGDSLGEATGFSGDCDCCSDVLLGEGEARLRGELLPELGSGDSALTTVQMVLASRGVRDRARRACDEDTFFGGGVLSSSGPRRASELMGISPSSAIAGSTGEELLEECSEWDWTRETSEVCSGEEVGRTSSPSNSKRTRRGLGGGFEPEEVRRMALRGILDSLCSEVPDDVVSFVARRW
jgi:hypothetical protein